MKKTLRIAFCFFIFVATTVLLVFPISGYTVPSHAQTKNQGINALLSFIEPTVQLRKMASYSNFQIDIHMNNVHITEVDTWQGFHPRHILAIHYTDLNNDEISRRIVLVIRSSLGNPWVVADIPVKNPASEIVDVNRTIWFTIDIDKEMLQSDPKIRPSWFSEIAISTVEIAVVDGKEINVGDAPGSESLTGTGEPSVIKIADLSVFP